MSVDQVHEIRLPSDSDFGIQPLETVKVLPFNAMHFRVTRCWLPAGLVDFGSVFRVFQFCFEIITIHNDILC